MLLLPTSVTDSRATEHRAKGVKKMRYEKTYSTIKPDVLDLTSSPKSVYIRKDIRELPPDENGIVMYEYDEACIIKDEYIARTFTENAVRDEALQELILKICSDTGE